MSQIRIKWIDIDEDIQMSSHKVSGMADGTEDNDAVNLGQMNAAISNSIIGLVNLRGNHDASYGYYPNTGGSGVAGGIMKGDAWRISVSGVIGDKILSIGDFIVSLVTAPSSDSDWTAWEKNDDDATESNKGLVQLASLVEVASGVNSAKSVTPAGVKQETDTVISYIGRPYIGDKGVIPLATSGNYSNTGISITETPRGNVDVRVISGFVSLVVGNGVRTEHCYFSSDSGATAKTISSISATDVLYYNGLIVGVELDVNDKISLYYNH